MTEAEKAYREINKTFANVPVSGRELEIFTEGWNARGEADLEQVEKTRSYYPQNAFPSDGKSTDAKSAKLARTLMDHLSYDISKLDSDLPI